MPGHDGGRAVRWCGVGRAPLALKHCCNARLPLLPGVLLGIGRAVGVLLALAVAVAVA